MSIKAPILLAFTLLSSSFHTLNAMASEKDTQPAATPISAQDMAIFVANVAERISGEYVEKVDYNKLLEGALGGMLSSLDPHSGYLKPKKLESIQDSLNGEYVGLGMEVSARNGLILVVTPMDGSPADKAGLKPGDLILAIDGEPVANESLTESVNRMHGKKGKSVALLIRRDQETFDLDVKRDVIKVNPVKWRVEENVGYIRITTFIDKNTKNEVLDAISNIKSELGDKLEGYVLDLRNNAGGLLDQAVDVTDIFMKNGSVVSVKGRDGVIESAYSTGDDEDQIEGKPLVILINSGSASASEIVAGALQDHKRAVVVGTKSFGKGSVQVIMPMINGGALKLTTSRYYTPNDRSIQKLGIQPDIEIEQTVNLSEIDDARMRESDMKNSIKNGNKKSSVQEVKQQAVKKTTELEMSELKDYQLERAIDVVHGMRIYGAHLAEKFSTEKESIKLAAVKSVQK